MSIRAKVFKRIFSVFMAVLMVVTSVYIGGNESYADLDASVPYKWTRIESGRQLYSTMLELGNATYVSQLDRTVSKDNTADYNARILLVGTAADGSYYYFSSNNDNALGGSRTFSYLSSNMINAAKTLGDLYGTLGDEYFYTDEGMSAPYIKIANAETMTYSGYTAEYNPDELDAYALRRSEGEDVKSSSYEAYIGIYYWTATAKKGWLTAVSEPDCGYNFKNPYALFDFDDETGTANVFYRGKVSKKNTKGYPFDITSYISFSEEKKMFSATEDADEAIDFYVYVGVPTDDEEYLEYKYGIYVDTATGTPHEWTKITSDDQLKKKLIEISGKSEDQLDKKVSIGNRNDYNARLLIIGSSGGKTFYFSSNINEDSLGKITSYSSNNKINAARPFDDTNKIVGTDKFYTSTGLDTPFIKISSDDGAMIEHQYYGDEIGTIVWPSASYYTLLRSSGEKITPRENAFVGMSYRISSSVKATFTTFSDTGIFDNIKVNNPCTAFEFDATSGTAKLFYDAYGVYPVYTNEEDADEWEPAEYESTYYMSYSDGSFTVTENSADAVSFYIYLGVEASEADYKNYIKDNPEQEEEKKSDTKEEETKTETKEDSEEIYRYKWTKVTDAESFEETFIDIVSDSVGSEVYSTNKNILNSKDYCARIMIVSAGNTLLFEDGTLSAQSKPTDVDINSDKFYTESNFGLPYAKLVEEKRGGTVDYFAIRLADGTGLATGSKSFIGVEAAEDGNYKAAYKSEDDASEGISENSFTLSFYETNSSKVHIQANLTGIGTNRYMTASVKNGIDFVNSTNLIGTNEGTFYIFLGQPLTQKEYEDDVSGKNEKKEPTYTTSYYWKWTKVTSNEELNNAILARCGKTTTNQLNKNINSDTDYTARILLVPKANSNYYISSSGTVDLDGSIPLTSFDDGEIQTNSDGTLESPTSLDAPFIKIVGTSSLYYGSGDTLIHDVTVNDGACLTGVSNGKNTGYAIRRADGNDKPMALSKGNALFGAKFQHLFGKDSNGNWINGKREYIQSSATAGCFKNVSNYGSGYGWGDLNWQSKTSYSYDDYIAFKYDLAITSALITFSGDSASIGWEAGIKYKKYLELYNVSGFVDRKNTTYNGSGYTVKYINDLNYRLNLSSRIYNDVWLYCPANSTAVSGIKWTQDFRFIQNTGTHNYYTVAGVGNSIQFDVYIGEKLVRSSYSGVVGGIDAEFEDSLILEDSIAIPEGKTLTVNEGSTLIINGDVYNYGSIKLNGGTLVVNGNLKCVGSSSSDADGYKILATQGAQIIVMQGGSIYCYAATKKARNNSDANYAKILLINNSSMSVYGMVSCNTLTAQRSSSITVEHGGILVTNRYRLASDVQTFSGFESLKDKKIGDVFSSENFKDVVGLKLSDKSSIKVYGLLFIPKGYSADSSCTVPSSGQYTTSATATIGSYMVNW